ncbi:MULTISPECIES: small multidrug efflux protein [unclassified Rathayibacter]|uniref:small multidrug efflux protein n=1 Tax=unclassified Rathayibacter TaxID=2609250 RepID=UPI000CE7FD27|nr:MULTISPECIES: small multidrug efflux protein [unclassified Rathayibacter]PPH18183.1 small multidrug efflux protein [Rathayibacter sp. AY1F8]PPH75671.1 small multidrug efflux protein [Rathayibacter sp. AY1D4]PPH75695.1 small multidrug efflux protein [Rathayibacter sp. AY1D4]PPH90238.1 small multidrug efflux protein [Rathayibacter sp. AY1D3]
MTIISDAMLGFQDLIGRVPELVQPLVVAAAGAVPFIEGEGAASIGIIGGIHPVVAGLAGAIGNFVCVALLVLLGTGVRSAITGRSEAKRTTPRREKFQRAFTRYGVPGVSLLGPLLLPTHFTAVMLAGAGVGRGRILLWQGVAIALWTTVLTVIVGLAVSGATQAG